MSTQKVEYPMPDTAKYWSQRRQMADDLFERLYKDSTRFFTRIFNTDLRYLLDTQAEIVKFRANTLDAIIKEYPQLKGKDFEYNNNKIYYNEPINAEN